MKILAAYRIMKKKKIIISSPFENINRLEKEQREQENTGMCTYGVMVLWNGKQ